MEYYFKYARTVGAKYANIFVSYGENSRYYITDFAYDNKYWTLIYDKQSNNPKIGTQIDHLHLGKNFFLY